MLWLSTDCMTRSLSHAFFEPGVFIGKRNMWMVILTDWGDTCQCISVSGPGACKPEVLYRYWGKGSDTQQ